MVHGRGLVVNAKKSLSSYQLARDLGLNQKTAWFMEQRIRAEMTSKQNEIELQGIIEADETYIGGKPRKWNKRKNDDNNPKTKGRGRGTKKTPVIGAVERGGKVVARVAENLSGQSILQFVKDTINPDGSLLITDQFRSYRAVRKTMAHAVVNHQTTYVEGSVHTNNIESFWAIIKRAWYGSHHHYKKQYMPLYIAEAAWKYNNRGNDNVFGSFMQGCFA